MTFGGAQTPHDWSFTTSGGDPHSKLTVKHAMLWFQSLSPEPIAVTFTRSGGRHAPAVTIRPGTSAHLSLSPGSWQACGHQPATEVYARYDRCVAIIVTGVPKLRLGAGVAHGHRVRFPVRYSSVLRGRSATETITPINMSCVAGSCTQVPGRPSTRTIVLRSRTISLPLPPAGQGVELELATSAFQLRDAPWRSARAQVLFFRRSG